MAKIDWNLNYEEQETAHAGDVEFQVKKRIPHEKKMEFAERFASAVAFIDEDGSANWNPYERIYWIYLLIQYYTDIELHEDDNLGWIHDYAVEHDLEEAIDAVAGKDIQVTREFATRTADMIIMDWEHTHSLQGTLNRLTSDEEMEKLAHAAPLNEELINLLKMKEEMESGERVVPLAGFAKKRK